MGRLLNPSGDKVPPEELYDACRVMAKYVDWKGELSWDFNALHEGLIDPEFDRLIDSYLSDVMVNSAAHKGWKIPETTLIYPWVARKFPYAKYIHWIRDPRDSITGPHNTDDLSRFGVAYPETQNERERRAISWFYQYEIMKATPRPKQRIVVRFEDFVMKQEETLCRLEDFLGISLGRIVVREESIGRYKQDSEQTYFDFFKEAMGAHGYDTIDGA